METIHVPGFSPSCPPTKLRFKMYGPSKCVFSQVSNAGATTSSINLAEDIVAAICERAELKVAEVRFFDLQTAMAYRRRGHFTGDGDFHFDELLFDASRRSVVHWRPTRCPTFVTDDFLPGLKVKQTQVLGPSAVF